MGKSGAQSQLFTPVLRLPVDSELLWSLVQDCHSCQWCDYDGLALAAEKPTPRVYKKDREVSFENSESKTS